MCVSVVVALLFRNSQLNLWSVNHLCPGPQVSWCSLEGEPTYTQHPTPWKWKWCHCYKVSQIDCIIISACCNNRQILTRHVQVLFVTLNIAYNIILKIPRCQSGREFRDCLSLDIRDWNRFLCCSNFPCLVIIGCRDLWSSQARLPCANLVFPRNAGSGSFQPQYSGTGRRELSPESDSDWYSDSSYPLHIVLALHCLFTLSGCC